LLPPLTREGLFHAASFLSWHLVNEAEHLREALRIATAARRSAATKPNA
jgi:hypothetical protein